APQKRREIFAAAERELVERHGALLHYSPVRWRYRFDWFGSTLRIFLSKSFVSGLDTSGERGPSPSPCFGPHRAAGSVGFCIRSGMTKITGEPRQRQIARVLASETAECKNRNHVAPPRLLLRVPPCRSRLRANAARLQFFGRGQARRPHQKNRGAEHEDRFAFAADFEIAAAT